ncbi:multicopper oxidase family protein [Tessaracoccus lapidicaptus]|uniref:multicopper oxidase family protein n=1 Tax=Tessaracoccus lapidicaptus TaxID=1427523 RepID=UPI00333E98EB
MISRRSFIAFSGAGALTLFVVDGKGEPVAVAALRGGTLRPNKIRKYRSPLLVPPAMPLAAEQRDGVDVYEISLRQFEQQILPEPHPATTVWGYGPSGGGVFHAPSLTIEAVVGRPAIVTWRNELLDGEGEPLPHLLPVDPTLHWANPPGGEDGRDEAPDLRGLTYVPTAHPSEVESLPEGSYTRYWGPVPMVAHLHGAVGVGQHSDGYPEAWYLPAVELPDGYAAVGSWYEQFRGEATSATGVDWEPGSAVFHYPNDSRPAALWFHDHTLGLTRLNVYAGPAGFYLLRGAAHEGITVAGSGEPAVLPGPSPRRGDDPGVSYREIPLAIQDRSFNDDGSLFYPDTRAFFDDTTSGFIPDDEHVPPIWNPEFFGNVMIVNGRAWPFHTVEQRRYRFRVLNGCQSRFLILDFSPLPGVSVWQIANEGGLLTAPVDITTHVKNRVLLAPAERADLIVDFTDVPVGDYPLNNLGPDAPFGGSRFKAADPSATGRIMQFRVRPATSPDTSTPPAQLVLPPVPRVEGDPAIRRLALLEMMAPTLGVPVAAMLGVVDGDPAEEAAPARHVMWADDVVVDPVAGTTEIWELYNATMDAHPVHVHEVTFEVVDRQAITVSEELTPTVRLAAGSSPRPPERWETGRKETVIAYPGEVTRLKARFETPGRFVWHCHILEHEDNEMMLPFVIRPAN